MNKRANYQDDEQIKMSQILEIILRYKWTILTTFLVVFMIGAIYTFTQKRVYQASTSVIIEDNKTSEVMSMVRNDEKKQDIINEIEILNSYDLKLRVADKIISKPTLKNETDTLSIIKNAKVTKGVSDLHSPQIRDAIASELNNALFVTQKKETNIIWISVSSTRPDEAALIANAYAQTYKERDLERSRANSRELRKFLEEQNKQKNEQLLQSDSVLKDYMEKVRLTGTEMEATLLANKVANLQTELENNELEYQRSSLMLKNYKAELERLKPRMSEKLVNVNDIYIRELQQTIAEKEAKRDLARVVGGAGQGEGYYKKEMTRLNRDIDSLKSVLQDRTNKYIDNSINTYSITGGNTDQGNIISQLSGEIQQMQLKVRALEQSKNLLYSNLVKYTSQLNSLPEGTINLAKLQRERAFNEKLATEISEKYNNALLDELSTFGKVEILDRAGVPFVPVSPNIKFNMLIAILVGLSLGLVLAFIIHFARNRINTPRDVEYLGFKLISTIPRMKLEPRNNQKLIGDTTREYSQSLISVKNPNSEIYESYLRLGINLAYSFMDKNYKSLLITSAGPGAGKSATAINVSITLANLGKSVLLIDTDLRRPVLHKYFHKSMIPGLTDYLLEQKEFDEIIKSTQIKGLDVITCGGKLLNPSLILSSAKMKHFMNEEIEKYDFVIYDAPPLNPVTDAIHLAKSVDDIILVVRAEKTSVEELKRANELLSQVDISISGVVLNDFDAAKSPLSYGKHYGYYAYTEESKNKKWKLGRKNNKV